MRKSHSFRVALVGQRSSEDIEGLDLVECHRHYGVGGSFGRCLEVAVQRSEAATNALYRFDEECPAVGPCTPDLDHFGHQPRAAVSRNRAKSCPRISIPVPRWPRHGRAFGR